MLSIGQYKLVSVVMARFRLDGGAMFGVVPKVLWEKLERPDELNRIQLVMRSLLAVDEAGGRVIMVDSGAGMKWPADEAERYAIEPLPDALPAALARFGLTEADITDVVVTHLHFDHNGGITEWADEPSPQPAPLTGEGAGEGRATRLRFPQARHWLHRRHWEYVDHPTEKDRASFLPRDFAALRDTPLVDGRDGRPGLVLVDGGELPYGRNEPRRSAALEGDRAAPAIDGIRWFISRGHTPYQLLPIFEGDGQSLFFTGDVVPTASHLRPAWVMAYDLEPLVTIAEKRWMLGARKESRTRGRSGGGSVPEGVLLAFPHDRQVAGARVVMRDDRPVLEERLDL